MDEAERTQVLLWVWWDSLTDLERSEALGIGQHVPMPPWMVASLKSAGVPGVRVAVAFENPDSDGSLEWFLIPRHVVEFLKDRRSGGESD